jgi:hypothetical protein
MSLAEILPVVRMLPRADQLELVRVLSAELAAPAKQESEDDMLRRLFPPDVTFEIYTPQFSPEAADELARFLESMANQPK